MKHRKPIITLLFLATLLPEIATGSTPLYAFINPFLLVYLFVGYGLTVLLMREFIVRSQLNLFGIFLIGFAYTIINEGFLAKTLLRQTELPINLYDNYGYYFGISVPFAITITLFHACYSLLFPILATHFLFKDVKDEPWLSKKVSFALLLLPLSFGFFTFFGPANGGVGSFSQFAILSILCFVFIMLGLFFGRKKYKEGDKLKLTSKSFWLGVSSFLFHYLLLSNVLAGSRVPFLVFLSVAVIGIFLYIKWLRVSQIIQKETILLFILGGYFQTVVMILLFSVFFSLLPVWERIISTVIVFFIIFTLKKKILLQQV